MPMMIAPIAIAVAPAPLAPPTPAATAAAAVESITGATTPEAAAIAAVAIAAVAVRARVPTLAAAGRTTAGARREHRQGHRRAGPPFDVGPDVGVADRRPPGGEVVGRRRGVAARGLGDLGGELGIVHVDDGVAGQRLPGP